MIAEKWRTLSGTYRLDLYMGGGRKSWRVEEVVRLPSLAGFWLVTHAIV